MVDLEGKGINSPIILEFDGEFQINENIISDWYGQGVSASVNVLAEKISLDSIYPNPFNPTTSIKYQLSSFDQVKIGIYNLTGQLIEMLVNSQQDAGSYTLMWDASLHPSGIYFLSMETSNKILHQKLMLIK